MAAALTHEQRRVEQLARARAGLQGQCEAARGEWAAQRQQLAEVAQRRRATELLRERLRREEALREQRREQLALDEHLRRRPGDWHHG